MTPMRGRRPIGLTTWDAVLEEDLQHDSGWIWAAEARVRPRKFPDTVDSASPPPPPRRPGICGHCGCWPGRGPGRCRVCLEDP